MVLRASRDGAMAVASNVLQETGWGDVLAEVVVGVRGQPEVAVH